MTVLRLWLLLTAALLTGLAIWAFAPLLYFLALLALALGLLSAAMVAFARGLKAWEERGWRWPGKGGGADGA